MTAVELESQSLIQCGRKSKRTRDYVQCWVRYDVVMICLEAVELQDENIKKSAIKIEENKHNKPYVLVDAINVEVTMTERTRLT
jgi:hypothetical protein